MSTTTFPADLINEARTKLQTFKGNEAVAANSLKVLYHIPAETAEAVVKHVKAIDGGAQPVATPVVAAGRFKEIALRSAARGESRVLPILVGGKKPLIPWKGAAIDTASTEEWAKSSAAWIDQIAAKFPDVNAAVIAKPEEYLFLDEDEAERFRKGYEAFSGEAFPKTYTTSARANRCQSHWKQTDRTRQMGNIVQGDIVGGILSVRQRNYYVLAEGSQHKNGVDIYKIVDDSPIAPMPDRLVDYIESIRTDRNKETADFSKKPEGWLDAPFIHHNINNQVTSFIGHYISAKNINDPDELYLLIESKFEKNGCFEEDGVTPFAWDKDEVRGMCRKKVKEWKTGAELNRTIALTLGSTVSAPQVQPTAPEIDTSDTATRPVFPNWAIENTSIYEELVAPAIKASSKHAEFIALPAIQMMLNYLSGQVQIPFVNTNLNIFVGLISPYGQFFKSSSCKLAHDYFKMAGVCSTHNKDLRNVEGRVLIAQAGSPEGFGLSAQKINAKRAILFNDELGKFVSKAGIESSSFSSDLLSWYGSGDFGNNIKSTRDSFNFEAGTYCFGWLWATTDRGFNRHWPKLAGISSG